MNLHRALRLGIAVGIALALGTGGSAQAITVNAAAPVPMDAVAGEPWSAPAFDVDCQSASGQVVCTPKNTQEISPQQCFMGVSLRGERGTVCTTYEGHVQAIQADGGTPLVVKYGLSLIHI